MYKATVRCFLSGAITGIWPAQHLVRSNSFPVLTLQGILIPNIMSPWPGLHNLPVVTRVYHCCMKFFIANMALLDAKSLTEYYQTIKVKKGLRKAVGISLECIVSVLLQY